MSLKLKSKRFLFLFLEYLPSEKGYRLYHRFQKLFSREDLEFKINSSYNTFRIFEDITKRNGIKIQNKVIAEIGSGWLPLMPYFFLYKGKASRVRTFDLNRHYQRKNIQKLNEVFSDKLETEIKVINESIYSLPPSVDYHPNFNILNFNLAGTDLVFSRFVLEHVKPEDIKAMHVKFKNELRPGSHIVHFISPGDHRAYVDKKLSLQDFLKYSEEGWEKRHTKFDYHNRLRLPHYQEIFTEAGLEVVHLTYEVPDADSETYRKFKALEVHKDYLALSEEELMAGAINIILKV